MDAMVACGPLGSRPPRHNGRVWEDPRVVTVLVIVLGQHGSSLGAFCLVLNPRVRLPLVDPCRGLFSPHAMFL